MKSFVNTDVLGTSLRVNRASSQYEINVVLSQDYMISWASHTDALAYTQHDRNHFDLTVRDFLFIFSFF